MALRRLRQFSGLVDLPATEFDVDSTVKETAGRGGRLNVRYKKPRQNTVKLLLLMDSGGSMEYYSQLCSALFQAVDKSGHFKDLQVFYFHNCVYSYLYRDPTLMTRNAVPVSWALSNLSPEYKLIVVGDAQMSPHEIFDPFPGPREGEPASGLDCLRCLRDRYRNAIWLNPDGPPQWDGEWAESYHAIDRLFPMLPLTVEGLETGMKKLLNQ